MRNNLAINNERETIALFVYYLLLRQYGISKICIYLGIYDQLFTIKRTNFMKKRNCNITGYFYAVDSSLWKGKFSQKFTWDLINHKKNQIDL